MKVDGGCHCGWVTYEAYINTDVVAICHCSDCQRLSASAYRVVIASKEVDFKLLNNAPKDYIKQSGRPEFKHSVLNVAPIFTPLLLIVLVTVFLTFA
jgi:hypothetical protein